MTRTLLFTSESVTNGHPDKVCDQVSDAVLDACLEQDPSSRVACETAVKDNNLILLGEITSNAKVDFEAIAREVVRDIGFDDVHKGMDYKTFKFQNLLSQQSPDIAQSVWENHERAQLGAGDQGLMFGYASDETPELMPMTHLLATQLSARLESVRDNGTVKYLRPDGKTQVTMVYEQDDEGHYVPREVHTIIISTQHDEGIELKQIHDDLMEHVIKPVVPERYLTEATRYFLNPSGRFVIGGPTGDAGVTGRKIIVDTYGGWGAHGGGAFSGKDFTKVDRSASYYARYIAKHLVSAGVAHRILVQLSYAIGIAEPISIHVNTYNTGNTDNAKIREIIMKNFDMRPGSMVDELGLEAPIYRNTACHGHFGRQEFPWETVKPELVAAIKATL